MRIGIIDADLIGRNNSARTTYTVEDLFNPDGTRTKDKQPLHRFPNLACMKISGYHKGIGDTVTLLMDYSTLDEYDKVYISKVFTDTAVPEFALTKPNVSIGGTGFYFDKAPKLPCYIEHHMPDYHLYDDWVEEQIRSGVKKEKLKEYTDYSIGFTTRGCFRGCKFCVNQNYKKVEKHSPLSEFLDPTRKKIILLDDNFLGLPNWKEILDELNATGKRFKFKQGLDERLLTRDKVEALMKSRYDGAITFAFDRIQDFDLVESKLKLLREYTKSEFMFYVLVGFDEDGKYDDDFWYRDIINYFKRTELLLSYGCYPYVMRYNKYEESPYKGMYINFARYCNAFVSKPVKKLSYAEWLSHPNNQGAPNEYTNIFLKDHPEFLNEYQRFFDMKFIKAGGYTGESAAALKPVEEYVQLTLADFLQTA